MTNKAGFDSRELFRYVRIEQPRITDIALRTKRSKSLSIVLKNDKPDQEKWARDFIELDKSVSNISDLSFPYFDHLMIESPDPVWLPTAKDLSDTNTFKRLNPVTDIAYNEDRDNALASVLAYRILDMPAELEQSAKLLSFIDEFPRLTTTTQRRPYARPIFDRFKFKTPKNPKPSKPEEPSRYDEMMVLSNDVRFLWQVKNQMKRTLLNKYDAAIRDLQRVRFEEAETETKANPVTKEMQEKASTRRPIDCELQKKHVAFLKERNAKLAKLREERNTLDDRSSMESVLLADAETLSMYSPGKSPGNIRDVQTRMISTMGKYNISHGKFCNVYEKVAAQTDRELATRSTNFDPSLLLRIQDRGCFLENPDIAFENTIRILGLGNLIKVEETFIGYKPAEISYIENILPGEVRKREVKSTQYFEQIQEKVLEETTDTSQETGTTSTLELGSEIESEINTRFNSDVNASVNASGGGTIGVVDLSGGAAVNAGLGIGIDTSLATSDTSEFSQEILNKAVEKTKKSTLERRLTRSYSLFETTNLHEIDNQSDDAKNGIYVFLDKEVCIKETTYGKRLFLLANVMLPGKNLLCEKGAKIVLAMMDQGQKPVFDISPEDIHPYNYRELVGKFNASNVQPPPSPIQTIARTYKTDTTNANMEQQEFNVKKVADVLVPFFERYKRFIITDTIMILDGYEAQEVTVTVNHGKNGLSIPAHLPLSITAASIYATPSLMTAVPYAGLNLPFVFWQIAYLVSPLLHYNTDSSNVTVSVANESHDSPYYFLEPTELIREVFDLLGNFPALTTDNIEQIRDKITTMMDALGTNAEDMSTEMGTLIQGSVNDLVSKLGDVFEVLTVLVNPVNLLNIEDNLKDFDKKINNLNTTVSQNFGGLMGGDFFNPIQDFINESLDLISNELNSALAEVFEYFTNMSENTQNLDFYSVAGMRGQIPIALNTVSIKPGVSVTLTVCAVRTEEALDQWRLDTFSSLYQSYLQQMAEYENRLLTMSFAERVTTSPGNMRREERLAVKELVLHALNNYHSDQGNGYGLERINFFENAIDWNNMSYRLYNYGPNIKEIVLDKYFSAYQHVDDHRRAFLKAHWAQVLIPVQKNAHFEAQVEQYFEEGTFDFEGEFTNEELAALYQDLILGRELLNEEEESTSRNLTIPTDFIIIQDQLPHNDDHTC